MNIVEFRIFKGRNIYSHKKCIRLDIELKKEHNIPSKYIKDFNENLIRILPQLKEHRCGIDEEEGFLNRLKEGTYLPHICEHIIIAIQNIIDLNVSYGKSREIFNNKYYIIYEYEYEKTGIKAGKIAINLINSIIQKRNFNLNLKIKQLINILNNEKIGPSTLSILKEAKNRGIPFIKIGDGSMFQIGYGKSSKMIEATIGNNTRAVSVDVSCDKLITKDVLNKQCIPVAEGYVVKNEIDLLFKADTIGYPLVLKPRFGNQGKGVITNIKTAKELLESYKTLKKVYKSIIVEKYVKGKDYRICVVGGEVVAVAERIPPFVIGNGFNSIEDLISIINSDERRGFGHEKPLTKIKIDEETKKCILSKGYRLNSVLPRGKKLELRNNANLSTGGISIDCTDKICKENIELCQRAAKAIGLDICGIDICCSDISNIVDGAIIEVNAAPGIRMHHYPYKGTKRNVAGKILDKMFNNKENIPVISITGTNGKTTTTRLISHVLNIKGYKVGMTTTGGIYIDNKCIYKGDTTGYKSAMTVLTNKDVDVAVLETARGGIIKSGIAYDLADIGIITNIGEDHLGLEGINTLDDIAYIKSLVVEAVKDNGYAILNADDKMSYKIIDRIKSRLVLFSMKENSKLIKENIDKVDFAIYIKDNYIYFENSSKILPIVKVEDIAITLNGILTYNIENSMAACAALIAMGIDKETIKKGFSTFYNDSKNNPGRFNLYKLSNNVKVILDYGHNIDGYKSVLKAVSNIEHNRLIGIVGVPGDRTDTSIFEIGKIAARHFDYIYIKEDKYKRGRKPGEVANILEKGILSEGFNKQNIKKILIEEKALNYAINFSKPGDLIVIFFEEYTPLLNIINNNVKNEKQKVIMA
ncbi:cyanophycin synthetase [Clostridium acetireducens DSM 10703]|uniref:Cyanophycin synthetase n=1 Tax=Clostridium acetireducens DSM 10703 TaxID=1121290 RepID=A0A1E8EYZ0_9CLOT|nr:cyanophycin synthetase [Clostridium acetireducens]OFI06178.1 cyanophycin synthetase [Clostridium acetireducens DSM 10703]